MSISSERVINWRKRTKHKMVMAMGGQCQICGYKKCDEALEFHHLDPSQKDMAFGKFRANPVSIQKLIPELKKCILVCSVCHKEIHAGITELPENFAQLDEAVLLKSQYDVLQEQKTRKETFKKDRIWKQKLFMTDIEVFNELNSKFSGNKSQMATQYGVSESAIRKRLKKLSVSNSI